MSDYFFYDMNKKMADLAKKQQLAEDAQAAPVKPAPNRLMEAAADYSAKKAAAGKDIGKPGKNFSKIAAGAAKKYGSAEAGKRVAGAVLNKLRHPTKEGVEPPKHYGPSGQPSVGTAKFDRYMQQRWAEHEATRPVPIAPPGVPKPVNEGHCSACDCSPCECDSMDESALQAAFGKKKYGGPGMKALQKAGRNGASEKTKQNIRNRFDKYDEGMTDEGNAFSKAVVDAKRDGIQPGEKVRVGGKQYPLREVDATPQHVDDWTPPPKPAPKASAPRPPVAPKPAPKKPAMYPPQAIDEPVKEGGVPMTPKQKKFAALAKPFDKISFADKIVGAKNEVDEMLGDVAATAMKSAVGKMRGRNRDMDETSDWSKLHEPFSKDKQPGKTWHGHQHDVEELVPGQKGNEWSGGARRVTRRKDPNTGYSVGADDETPSSGKVGRKSVGSGQGTKIGAKINRGTSKLMTKEGDMPEDMIEPQDSGEYDREGEMAKDDIKTVVRHAQALEKILGDEDNLPEWVQSKLAKIEGMMTAVDDYMQNQKSGDMEMDEESTNKRDNRAERAGRRVAKDIEYDEKRKDGIHGKRRGSEDSKAERAGKKVTKDIEYDEKKNKKKKEVDETTTSGSVATGSAPKSGSGHNYGKGIYDSLNRQLENMISEGMNINMSMNNDDHGGPKKSLTVTATDEDAVMLSSLLKMAGLGNDDDHMHDMTDDDSQMLAIQTMGDEDACSACGSSPCGCDSEEMYEGLYDSGAKAAFKLAPEAEAALAKYGPEVLQKIKDLIQSTGGPKITKLPYMGPPKEVDDFAAQVLKSPYEPGIAKPTNRIPTIDKAPQMGKSNDTPVFDKSTRQSGMARDPFDPLVDEDRWGAEQPPKLPNDMTVTADGGVDVKKSGSDWVYKSKEPGGRVTVTIPAKASNKMFPKTDVDEAYGDTDASENDPDYPTDEVGTDDAMMYSGGLNGPKSTGQTTVPVISGQKDRMGYEGDHELRRMMEIAGLR